MKRVGIFIMSVLAFCSCQRPMMKATLEAEQPKEKVLTYAFLHHAESRDDVHIQAAIEHNLNENGLFKSPFQGDLNVYYQHELSHGKENKIKVYIVDGKTNSCVWRGEMINLPKKLTEEKVMAYTYLLMERFDWSVSKNSLFVKN